jgi:hypothetical protein
MALGAASQVPGQSSRIRCLRPGRCLRPVRCLRPGRRADRMRRNLSSSSRRHRWPAAVPGKVPSFRVRADRPVPVFRPVPVVRLVLAVRSAKPRPAARSNPAAPCLAAPHQVAPCLAVRHRAALRLEFPGSVVPGRVIPLRVDRCRRDRLRPERHRADQGGLDPRLLDRNRADLERRRAEPGPVPRGRWFPGLGPLVPAPPARLRPGCPADPAPPALVRRASGPVRGACQVPVRSHRAEAPGCR